jgi:dolichol-phosphate mannosyltransferase
MVNSTLPKLLSEPSGEYIITNQVNTRLNVQPLLLSLIIPTYNERGNIEHFVRTLIEILDAHIQNNYEVIIVDDILQAVITCALSKL